MNKPATGKDRGKRVEPVDRWAGDHFGRQNDSKFLQSFLISRAAERKARKAGRSYVVNLDAGWGRGKTYFLERFRDDLSENFTVAYVNAWEDDHADDPLIAMMLALEAALIAKAGKASTLFENVKRASGKLAVTLAKHATLGLAQRFIGQDGIQALSDAINRDDAKAIEHASEGVVTELVSRYAETALKEFELTKSTIEEFKDKLRQFVSSTAVQPPLFILIDELDRCRPSYAVALLERIKHLFDIENIVFVIATDTDQLRHAVTAVYGVGFDGSGYLLRFFDRTYRFAIPVTRQFIQAQFDAFAIPTDLLSSPPRNNHLAYFSGVVEAANLSPREIKRCFDLFRSAITMWPYKEKKAQIELAYLLPLIVAYCRGNTSLFDSLSKFKTDELRREWGGSNVILPYDEPGRDQAHGIGIFEATEKLLERANDDLRDAVNVQRRPSGAYGWVYDRHMHELQTIHGRSSSRTNWRSELRIYPELVRSVGRLTPEQ